MNPSGQSPARAGPPAAHRGSIDLLRGLVCLGVIVMHFHSALAGPTAGGRVGRFVEFALVYGRLGVESFFVLAGYFLAHTFRPSEAHYLSVPRHVRRRFLRLALPYWVVVISLFLGAWAANVLVHRSNPSPTAWQVAAVLLFAQDIFVDKYFPFFTLWSMAPLFQSYLAWILAYWTVRRIALWLAPAGYQELTPRAMIALTYAVLVYSMGVAGAWTGAGWQLPGWAWAFALGALTYWRARRLTGWPPFAVTVAALLPASFLAGGHPLFVAKALVCSLVLLALGRGLRAPDSVATRALGYVGHRSYSVYLVHGPVGFRVIGWMAAFSPPRTQGMFLVQLMVATAAGVVAGLVFYRLVERPTARLAGGVEYRR